jgi:nitroreductase
MSETNSLLPAIANRWSPRSFTNRAIEPETLRKLFQAARWSASCFNEQPWRFAIATQADPEQFAKILGLLVPFNQDWAGKAFLVGITVASRIFGKNGNANRFGMHDTGAALANLAIEASALGLQSHGMGGFDADRARMELGIPEEFEVCAAFAVGYVEEPAGPPADRGRRPLSEIVFGTEWGKAAL